MKQHACDICLLYKIFMPLVCFVFVGPEMRLQLDIDLRDKSKCYFPATKNRISSCASLYHIPLTLNNLSEKLVASRGRRACTYLVATSVGCCFVLDIVLLSEAIVLNASMDGTVLLAGCHRNNAYISSGPHQILLC